MKRWLQRLGFAAFTVFLVGRVWLFEVAWMANDGMNPSLLAGEAVLVLRGPLASTEPGSVVLYDYGGVVDLKRVVAAEGQVAEVSSGSLYIDGEMQRQEDGEAVRVTIERGCEEQEVTAEIEPWRGEAITVLPGGDSLDERVPSSHIYVLGDHRAVSSDSRQWGPLPVAAVRGSVSRVLWSRDPCGDVRWFRIGRRLR